MTKITKTIAAPATAKVTKTAQATGHTAPKPEVAGEHSVYNEAVKRFNDAREELFAEFKLPSWKRTLVAFLSTIAVAVGVGTLTTIVLDCLVIGALTLALPLFITVAMYVIAALVAAYYGGRFAIRVGGAVLTGEADEKAAAAYTAVKGVLARFNPFGKATVEAA